MNLGFAIQPSGYFYALPMSIGVKVDDLIVTPEPVFFSKLDCSEEPPFWLPIALAAAQRLSRIECEGRC